MAIHLLFLWVMFSGGWSKVVHGPLSFAAVFIVASGAWVPLSFTLLAGAAGFYESPKCSIFRDAASPQLCRRRKPTARPRTHAAIGGTLGRIVAMQVAVILGAMLANTYGTTAPWLILIGLKTLLEFQRPQARA